MNERPMLGSCMGFGIRSTLQLETLRDGGGPSLVVEPHFGTIPDGEEVLTWQARPGNPFHGRLLRTGRRYAFWASDAGWFVVDPDVPSIAVEQDLPSLLAELRMFGVPASLCAAVAGDVALHASAVEIDGRAVLFGGPSMHGKTTLAAALSARGHRLLAEDTVRCTTGPVPHVYPGPSAVRLRSDVASVIQLPGTRAIAMPNGRVSLLLDAALRGDGAALPLRAVVLLRAGDRVTLSPVAGAAAARDLFALAFRLPVVEDRASAFARIVDLVARVEVLDLHRPLTFAATDEAMDALEDVVRA